MLGTPEESADHCAETYIARSWKIRDGETIYICEKEQETPTPPETFNYDFLKDKTTPCFVEGEETTRCYAGNYPNNYVKIGEENYRILKVNSDSSLLIYGRPTIEEEYKLETTSRRYIDTSKRESADFQHIACNEGILEFRSVSGYIISPTSSMTTSDLLDSNDLLNTIKCNGSLINSWMPVSNESYDSIGNYTTFRASGCSIRVNLNVYQLGSRLYDGTVALCGNSYNKTPSDYKTRLKPCMQIKEGVGNGSLTTPYEIVNNCNTN